MPPVPVLPASERVALPNFSDFALPEGMRRHLKWLDRVGKVHNLTRVPKEEWVIRHVFDSLVPMWAGLDIGSRFLDMGAGPGFPGIPLVFAFPHAEATLVESKAKVVRELEGFLISEGLGPRVKALGGRLEDLARDGNHREGYDRVVTRALASLPVLIELGVPFLRPGGLLWCWKSGLEDSEEASPALKELNARIVRIFEYTLPGEKRSRVLLAIERTGILPDRYPRRAGIPQKRPLG